MLIALLGWLLLLKRLLQLLAQGREGFTLQERVREVSLEFHRDEQIGSALPPGQYTVMPFTEPPTQSHFTLTVVGEAAWPTFKFGVPDEVKRYLFEVALLQLLLQR